MDAQLEILREPVSPDGVPNDGEIIIKLLFELIYISGVIDSLIKSAREFWRNGLNRNLLVRQSNQNNQEFWRGLRSVRFVHRDFRNKTISFHLLNMSINIPGFFHSSKVFARDALGVFPIHIAAECFRAEVIEGNPCEQLGMSRNKAFDLFLAGRFRN